MTVQRKVVVIGLSGVGKTSIIQAIQGSPFVPNCPMTIAGGCVTLETTSDEVPVKLSVWDTAGQERYRSIVSIYFKTAHVIVIVYDITDRESIDSIEEWLAMISESGSNQVPLILVGNKTDLREQSCVDTAEGEARAREIEAVAFTETSALTREGIQDLLAQIASSATRNLDRQETSNSAQNVQISEELQKTGGCC
jgi:small GTP-binding protein